MVINYCADSLVLILNVYDIYVLLTGAGEKQVSFEINVVQLHRIKELKFRFLSKMLNNNNIT